MKKNFKDSGIVLRRLRFKEADHIVTFLTKKHGRLSFIAKGSQRLNSKFCGRLETGSELSFEGVEGKGLHYLKEVKVLDCFQGECLEANAILFFMAEVVCRLAPENQESEEVYMLLRQAFLEMALKNHNKNIILKVFLVKLLTEMGFVSSWDRCIESHQKIDLQKPIYLSQEGGPSQQYSSLSGSRTLSVPLVKWINFIQKNTLSQSILVKPEESQLKEAWDILLDHLNRLLLTPLKSERFLNEVIFR